MRILLDMDGVVADLIPYWVDLLNRYCGENLTPQDITQWDLHTACKHATAEQVYEFLRDPGFFLHLKPIDGAIETIEQLLTDGHEIVFVTSCKWGHEDKRLWIKRHFPVFPMENIVFAERKELVKGDVLLDDYTKNLVSWKKSNIGYAVCFDAPYNKDYQNYRVRSWDEFYELIKELSPCPFYS